MKNDAKYQYDNILKIFKFHPLTILLQKNEDVGNHISAEVL